MVASEYIAAWMSWRKGRNTCTNDAMCTSFPARDRKGLSAMTLEVMKERAISSESMVMDSFTATMTCSAVQVKVPEIHVTALVPRDALAKAIGTFNALHMMSL